MTTQLDMAVEIDFYVSCKKNTVTNMEADSMMIFCDVNLCALQGNEVGLINQLRFTPDDGLPWCEDQRATE